MENRSINEEYSEIATNIIEEEDELTDVANSHATIVYLSSDKAKKGKDKIIHAESLQTDTAQNGAEYEHSTGKD